MKDSLGEFSVVQALTVDEVSDYYLDVKAIAEVGRGSQLYVNVDVCSIFRSTAYATLDIWLCTHTAAPTSTHRLAIISASKLTAGGAGAANILHTVGKKVKIPLPSLGLLDHVGLHYEVTGSGLSSGAVNAYLTLT